MPISDNITNGLIVSGRLKTAIRNAPAQYAGRQRQYLGDPSTEFVHQYAKYATDFFAARVQGLNPDAPYEWETTMIRMADIAPETASTLRKQDDYKNIIFADESIEYVPEGTKIEAMGSIWLVTNPQNISNAIGGGVIQRCRSTWNHLDWYGNLLKEPICVEKAILTANESDMQEYYTTTQCRDLAEWKLKRTTVLQKAVSIQCIQMMHIFENSLVEIVRTDKPSSPVERHLIQGFTRPLTSNGTMTINAVSVADFPIATITSWPK